MRYVAAAWACMLLAMALLRAALRSACQPEAKVSFMWSCCRVRLQLTISMKAISAQMVSLANIPLHGRQRVSAWPPSCLAPQDLLVCNSIACPQAACTHKYRHWLYLWQKATVPADLLHLVASLNIGQASNPLPCSHCPTYQPENKALRVLQVHLPLAFDKPDTTPISTLAPCWPISRTEGLHAASTRSQMKQRLACGRCCRVHAPVLS